MARWVEQMLAICFTHKVGHLPRAGQLEHQVALHVLALEALA